MRQQNILKAGKWLLQFFVWVVNPQADEKDRGESGWGNSDCVDISL